MILRLFRRLVPKEPDFESPRQLAWLLRKSIQKLVAQGTAPRVALLAWWAMHGRKVFPEVGTLSEVEKAALFLPSPDYPSISRFGLCPLLQWILMEHDDLSMFDRSTEPGILGLNAWLYCHGIREYDIAEFVDRDTIAALDDCPPWFSGTLPTPPTWLMFLVWHGRRDLQDAFDLKSPDQLSRFLSWFFARGLAETGCAKLVTDRWEGWLREPVDVERERRISRNGAGVFGRLAALAARRLLDFEPPTRVSPGSSTRRILARRNIAQLELPRQFISLLWKDAREFLAEGGDSDEGLLVWWVIHGRKAFPHLARLSDREREALLSPLPEYPIFSRFGVSPLLRWIWAEREDLRRGIDVGAESGVVELNAWFYVHGIRSYELADFVDRDTIALLDGCPPCFSGIQPDAPTWLMFFVWQGREDLQRVFRLYDPDELPKFISWFFVVGLAETGCAPLVAERWKMWLREDVPVGPRGLAVPRVSLFCWQQRAELRQRFDIETAAGVHGLRQWCAEKTAIEPVLAWLALERGQPVMRRPERIEHETTALFGVNLIGFAFGELGIGEDIRMAATACEAAGVPYAVVNISPGAARQNDKVLAPHLVEGEGRPPYPINIFCLPGFDTAHTYLIKGEALFRGRYNIGWWPWELPVWPAKWNCAFELVDEIWAAADFTFRMYRSATKKPVYLMPLAVSVDRSIRIRRVDYGIPEEAFVFLYVFDVNSYLERKNPRSVIEAFWKAFPRSDDSLCLVLKTMNAGVDNPGWREFNVLCRSDPRIVLIDGTMDREKLLGLISACNAYVSLHRSEGFGRTLAEAMLFGKPVVATDYGGNRDFLTRETGFPVASTLVLVKEGEYPFIETTDGAVWAKPDIEHAAVQMRAARAVAGDKRFSSRVHGFAKERFSPERVGAAMAIRLKHVFGFFGSSRGHGSPREVVR